MKASDSSFSLFLENNILGNKQNAAYFYEQPIRVITATQPEELENTFASIEQALEQGFHVAGWMSYEAGLCLEDKLHKLIPEKLEYPLLKMGVFKQRQVLSAEETEQYWQEFEDPAAFTMNNLVLNQSRDDYEQAFTRIKKYLNAGDIYQVNYTQKACFDFKGSSKSFYAALRNAQAVEYAAYIESEDLRVLSLSPELLVKKTGEKLITKPMKGTCKRGRTIDEDKQQSEKLHATVKERAENLMIVDLLRNDLSKLSKKGSVKVEKIFEVEKYRTFYSMTSSIEAILKNEKSISDVIKAVFPCGSVTGAPKIRAQQIISELESQQRGIYTGAIGYFTPEGDMCFSVPIRTLTIDKAGKAELGIGGGIVADSIVESEYEESLLKAQFALKQHPKFELIESMLWSNDDGFKYLDSHLKRLEHSANYFDYTFNKHEITKALKKYISANNSINHEALKVRLLLSKRGEIKISSEIIKHNEQNPIVFLSDNAIDSQNPLFFHKTTDRDFYNKELQSYQSKSSCFDVIFTNERGELTEGTRSNLFIKQGDTLYTPPIECGLLAGVYRQQLLENANIKTAEKILYPEDLNSSDQIYLCNSVRGMVPVHLNKNYNTVNNNDLSALDEHSN